MPAARIGRGIRAALIIGAVLVLAWGWGIDIVHLRGRDTWVSRLADPILWVTLPVADLLWQAAIEREPRRGPSPTPARPVGWARLCACRRSFAISSSLSSSPPRR